ncbi:Ff.00g122540.m01.CDS01 [Fusarium sp. VM40]|nr:Ff.00g122540.m01.CDS01 [Fusarium sp. VM40]
MASTVPQVVLFGDSLFQQCSDLQEGFSFQAALQSDFIRRLDIVNRGYSGFNTDIALRYLPDVFPERTASSPKMDYLVLLFGANDAVLPDAFTKQHVPIDRYKTNLTKIVNHPHIAAHKPQILLVTPPPLDEIKSTPRSIENGHKGAVRTSTVTAAYAEVARQVARENPEVVLVDLWQAQMDKAVSLAPGDYTPEGPFLGDPENGKQGGLDDLLHDGLHMSGLGYQVFYETLKPLIGKEWHGLPDDDRRGFAIPDWRELLELAPSLNTGD